jgi:hypothetical protein
MHQPVQGNTTALIHSQAGQLGTFVDLTIPLVWKVLGDVAGISLPGKLGARLELVVASNTFPHPTVRAAHVFYIDDLHCPVRWVADWLLCFLLMTPATEGCAKKWGTLACGSIKGVHSPSRQTQPICCVEHMSGQYLVPVLHLLTQE